MKLHARNPRESPQRQSNLGSNATYFDTNNFKSRDCIIRRQKETHHTQSVTVGLQYEEEEPCKLVDPYEKHTSGNIFFEGLDEFIHKHGAKKQKPFFGLRRPLENGTKIELEPGEIDLDQWAAKPYSTVACQLLGYQDIFPLHMQRVTEAEDKDNKQIQTETRRHSVVTTDYFHGRISLQSDDGNDVEFGVFPVLHKILSTSSPSNSSSSDIDYTESQTTLDLCLPSKSSSLPSSANSSFADLPKLPVEFPSGFNLQRKRISIAAGRHVAPPRPRVVRRRSLDYSGVSLAFVHALEAASQAMKSIKESQDEEEGGDEGDLHDAEGIPCPKKTAFADAARAVFDAKYAEETMDHLDGNLRTLETFLKESKSSESSVVVESSGDEC